HVVGVFLEKLGVRHDQLDAGQVRAAEADAAIDNNPLAGARRTKTVRAHIHADFTDAAKRHEDKLIPWGFGHGSFYPCSGRTPRELWSPVALPFLWSASGAGRCPKMYIPGGDGDARAFIVAHDQPSGGIDRFKDAVSYDTILSDGDRS